MTPKGFRQEEPNDYGHYRLKEPDEHPLSSRLSSPFLFYRLRASFP